MPPWRPHLVETARLKYLGIVEALDADIRAGRLRAGDRLPPQRAIAEALQVDLTTVTRAFNEARERGLVDAQVGRGTFVREETAAQSRWSDAPALLDLSMNIPPQPAAADLQRRLPADIRALLSGSVGMLHLHYQESTGSEADRIAGSVWLGRRAESIAPSRILVAAGAQAALFAVCECLLKSGDAIAAGALTYPGLKAIASQKELTLVPLSMDAGGIIPEAFAEICRRRPPKALYVIPTIDNPTTATLSQERRVEIAGIARSHGVTIIEDDPYVPLSMKRIPAFLSLAGDITWHIATLSKCVTPALRIAYVATPGNGQALRLAGVLRATTLMAPPLTAALATRWISDGTLNEISGAIRAESAARQIIAATILRGTSFAADPNGHHLWLSMPARWRAADFAEQSARSGVAVVPASAFAVGPDAPEAVRVSLGVAPDRGALEDALTLLAGILEQPSIMTRAVV